MSGRGEGRKPPFPTGLWPLSASRKWPAGGNKRYAYAGHKLRGYFFICRLRPGAFPKPISFSLAEKEWFLRSKEKGALMALLGSARKRHGGLRLFVVTKSAPLYFRLTAKIRCAPLLLLSQMDPLRWAPFGPPGIGPLPATAIRGRNRERSWSYLSAAWFVDQAGRGAVPVWTETPAFERTRKDQPCSSAAWPAEGQRGQTVDLLLSYARAPARPVRGRCPLTAPAPGGRISP